MPALNVHKEGPGLSQMWGEILGKGLSNFNTNYNANKALDKVLNDPKYKESPASEKMHALSSALTPFGEVGEGLLINRLTIENQEAEEKKQKKFAQGDFSDLAIEDQLNIRKNEAELERIRSQTAKNSRFNPQQARLSQAQLGKNYKNLLEQVKADKERTFDPKELNRLNEIEKKSRKAFAKDLQNIAEGKDPDEYKKIYKDVFKEDYQDAEPEKKKPKFDINNEQHLAVRDAIVEKFNGNEDLASQVLLEIFEP